MGSEMCIRDRLPAAQTTSLFPSPLILSLDNLILVGLKHIATPPPLDPLSFLMILMFAPVHRSLKTLGGQSLDVSQVSVSIAMCRPFSSNNVINDLIF